MSNKSAQRTLSTYNIRISNEHQSHLDLLVTTGELQRSPDVIGLTGGETYRLKASHIQAVDDHHLLIAGAEYRADVYRLPTSCHQAVIRQSPGFRRLSGEANLHQKLLQPMTDQEERQWLVQALEISQSGNWQPAGRAHTRTRWHPTHSSFVRQEGRWFLTLEFSTPRETSRALQRSAIGVDVGILPLATAATERASWATQPLHLLTTHGMRALERQLQMTPAHIAQCTRDLILRSQYAAARTVLDELTRRLLLHATSATVEQLQRITFQSGFVAKGRQTAVWDWYQSWLPQRLYAAGIPLYRVRPAFTSRLCSRCGRHGVRAGGNFRCCRCGNQDAHVNAARNILKRSWSRRRDRRDR